MLLRSCVPNCALAHLQHDALESPRYTIYLGALKVTGRCKKNTPEIQFEMMHYFGHVAREAGLLSGSYVLLQPESEANYFLVGGKQKQIKALKQKHDQRIVCHFRLSVVRQQQLVQVVTVVQVQGVFETTLTHESVYDEGAQCALKSVCSLRDTQRLHSVLTNFALFKLMRLGCT